MTIEDFKAEICTAFPHIAPNDITVDTSGRTGVHEYYCAYVGGTDVEIAWFRRDGAWRLSGHSAATLPDVMAMARTWAFGEVARLTRKATDLNGGLP